MFVGMQHICSQRVLIASVDLQIWYLDLWQNFDQLDREAEAVIRGMNVFEALFCVMPRQGY
jgi:hypothetical protein